MGQISAKKPEVCFFALYTCLLCKPLKIHFFCTLIPECSCSSTALFNHSISSLLCIFDTVLLEIHSSLFIKFFSKKEFIIIICTCVMCVICVMCVCVWGGLCMPRNVFGCHRCRLRCWSSWPPCFTVSLFLTPGRSGLLTCESRDFPVASPPSLWRHWVHRSALVIQLYTGPRNSSSGPHACP